MQQLWNVDKITVRVILYVCDLKFVQQNRIINEDDDEENDLFVTKNEITNTHQNNNANNNINSEMSNL